VNLPCHNIKYRVVVVVFISSLYRRYIHTAYIYDNKHMNNC